MDLQSESESTSLERCYILWLMNWKPIARLQDITMTQAHLISVSHEMSSRRVTSKFDTIGSSSS